MEYKCYMKVKITTEKFKEKGVKKGTNAIILEIYDSGNYELQFLDEDDFPTDIFFAVNEKNFILVDPNKYVLAFKKNDKEH